MYVICYKKGPLSTSCSKKKNEKEMNLEKMSIIWCFLFSCHSYCIQNWNRKGKKKIKFIEMNEMKEIIRVQIVILAYGDCKS